MARTVRDTRLESRAARLRLAPQHEPYWRAIDQGMHLGYRKGPLKASWIGRCRTTDGTYVKQTLGIPDDTQDADGRLILSFSQAQEKAREWFLALRSPTGTFRPYTVAEAASAYLDWYKTHRKAVQETNYSITAFILPRLGKVAVASLTTIAIRKWHEELALTPARMRGGGQRDALLNDQEEARRRKATANRVLTVLKAILNHAYRDGHVADDRAWRLAKRFERVDQPRTRYLEPTEWARLIAACDIDFAPLVEAAVLTGCRYGELVSARIGDIDFNAATLRIRDSKSGKGRHVVIDPRGIDLLRKIIHDRPREDLIFVKDDGTPWGKSHQFRRLREACAQADISPPVSFHILRHSHASYLAMSGLPLQVIAAQLGHADTRMAERHYAHLSKSYQADLIRNAWGRLS